MLNGRKAVKRKSPISESMNGRKRKKLSDSKCKMSGENKQIDGVSQECDCAGSSIDVTDLPNTLCGREKEIDNLEEILRNATVNGTSASLFISGPPGSGKTASVKLILNKFSVQKDMKPIYINCVSNNNQKDILARIIEHLKQDTKTRSAGITVSQIGKIFESSTCHVIIVLDEMDYIRPKDRIFLCLVFHWPSIYRKISVIGIANTFDMTELPRHKMMTIPHLLVFRPYTEDQLKKILMNKLTTDHMNSDVIELCARKVAAISGDVRKAVEVARRSLEPSNAMSGCRSVLNTMVNVYGSPLLKSRIPLQQKILLGTLLRLADDHSCANISKDKLLVSYEKVCKALMIPALDISEVYSALSLLESQSIVQCKPLSYQLLVDTSAAHKVIADSKLISQIDCVKLK